MNIGVLRENDPLDRRVALTPQVVRSLVERGNMVWVETGAGNGAMFQDDEYLRVGANIGYSPSEVIRRCELVVKVSVPSMPQLELCSAETALMAFYHMAVAGQGFFQRLLDHHITAIGSELIQTAGGRRPVLAAASEIAGRMTVPLADHLLRSSSGGRGILLGGSPGVPPAHVVVLGAGVVGSSAAKTALRAGARVTVLDIDTERLRQLIEHLPGVATLLADADSIATAVASADVVIGAVLVAGSRTPHIVTKPMVEAMRQGSVIIDVAIDQGGCVETSRPMSIAEPTYVYNGVVHYCVPNLTADMARSTSIAVAHALMPYLVLMAEEGVEEALLDCQELARGVYTYRGKCVQAQLAAAWKKPLTELRAAIEETRVAAGNPVR